MAEVHIKATGEGYRVVASRADDEPWTSVWQYRYPYRPGPRWVNTRSLAFDCMTLRGARFKQWRLRRRIARELAALRRREELADA